MNDSTTAEISISTAVVESSTSRKRPAQDLDASSGSTLTSANDRPTKLAKQQNVKVPAMFLPKSARPPQAFKWLPALALPAHQPQILSGQPLAPLGPATCLHGVHLEPKASPKVALFDLDDTLITRKSGKKFSDDPTDWKLWTENVGERLKKAAADGFAIVVVTNQAGLPVKGREEKWKTKIPMIAESAFKDIPFRVFAAKEKDGFRKPMLGMWDALVQQFKQESVTIDKSASFMVGDAAGRIRPKDFSAADRKLAENIGLKFYTPEEFFKGQKVELPPLDGFHPSKQKFSDSLPALISTSASPEVVLFVGPPGCGKSTIFKRHFASAGYVHVNQDTLGSKPKCVKEVDRVLSQHGKCVVDNTNRDKAARAEYIAIAKKHGAGVRCVHFDVPIELAWHNNMYRAFHMRVEGVSPTVINSLATTTTTTLTPTVEDSEEEDTKSKGKKTKKKTTIKSTTITASTATKSPAPRSLVPWIAYTTFRSKFEAPEQSEGFQEVIKIGFVYEGNGEEEQARWNTWMELN
ncbi:bifunctional polynucleotide phosphatase/kinase [Ceratobasidium sp. AG-Ba]|nr:bifunctional polynucleotide phosphatase/kinase [Ceratobasidium sp. AG-Ba]